LWWVGNRWVLGRVHTSATERNGRRYSESQRKNEEGASNKGIIWLLSRESASSRVSKRKQWQIFIPTTKWRRLPMSPQKVGFIQLLIYHKVREAAFQISVILVSSVYASISWVWGKVYPTFSSCSHQYLGFSPFFSQNT